LPLPPLWGCRVRQSTVSSDDRSTSTAAATRARTDHPGSCVLIPLSIPKLMDWLDRPPSRLFAQPIPQRATFRISPTILKKNEMVAASCLRTPLPVAITCRDFRDALLRKSIMPRLKTMPSTLPKRFEPKFWNQVDRRSPAACEIRKRYESLRADAGVESEQRDILCQRAVFLVCLLETSEITAIETGKLDVGQHVQAVNSLIGLLKALGLERAVKTATDLKSYIRKKA
jgi:hypothetical protein